MLSPIHFLDVMGNNTIYVKREDLIPYSFGGNKARKAIHFFEEIDRENYDYVVTYGTTHSNHCRIIANMSAARGIPCTIIGPSEVADSTYNSLLMKLFGSKIIHVPVECVHDSIEQHLEELRNSGKKPYFIPGGGHSILGTESFVECFHEIEEYEAENGFAFDYIFHASGTGGTQAGLVCGKLMHQSMTNVIGISIARQNPRGRNVVIDAVKEYNSEIPYDVIDQNVAFLDEYITNGYGKENGQIADVIDTCMMKYGLPLDPTYTGKAFWGMLEYMKKMNLENKRVLFLHTGGTPLFFDYLGEKKNEYSFT